MKSILFLVPKMNGPNGDFILNTEWNEEFNRSLQKRSWNVVTPSILLLASIAREEGFEVAIVDESFKEVNFSLHYDIVCFYTVTPNAKRAYDYSEIFKKKGSYIAMGGVHSSICRKEAKRFCDTLLIGEGEFIFRQFLGDYRNDNPQALYKNDRIVPLVSSPIPDYGLLFEQEQHLIPIQTARGCSHNCKFCNVKTLYGNGFRKKTPFQIEKELEEIYKLPYVRSLYLTDDNILSEEEHFYQLMAVLKESPLKWYANADISLGADELKIDTAYKAGIRQVLIGLESISEYNLKGIDKDNFKYSYLPKYKEYIHKIQSFGIGVTGSFIVGQEEDTEDNFKYLEEFIYSTGLYGANITIYTPYPGTSTYSHFDKKKKIATYDWNYYTIFQPVIKTKYLSEQRLNELYKNILIQINSKEFIHNKLRYFTNVYKNKE